LIVTVLVDDVYFEVDVSAFVITYKLLYEVYEFEVFGIIKQGYYPYREDVFRAKQYALL
jgi:hypothetical protein